MPVIPHELDLHVFSKLNKRAKPNEFDNWKGKASDISSYVATWGVVRFWALSCSQKAKGGQLHSGDDFNQNYYAWKVAREVLCTLVKEDIKINQDMNPIDFQETFKNLSDTQQVCLSELLIEIGDTIQFWTMRIKDCLDP